MDDANEICTCMCIEAVVIVLLVICVVWMRTDCSCIQKPKDREGRRKERATKPQVSKLREGAGLSNSFSKSKLWPDKRSSAPNLQRPHLSLGMHFYPDDTQPDWDIKSNSTSQM